MDPMVSARVPAGLRDQVNEGLRSIGSSPTELINRAYELFLDTKTLPGRSSPAKKGRRQLDRARMSALLKSIEETSFAVPESFFQDIDYDSYFEEQLRAAHEALA